MSPALLVLATAVASLQPGIGAVTGRVVDADTNLPLRDALVASSRPQRRVTTDADGRFEILDLEAGQQTLFVSLVGYVLARPEVVVSAGTEAEVLVTLTPGAGAYTEQLTVRGADAAHPPSAAPAEFRVRSSDLQELRGVLADDPIRAMQSLPGAATGDDFRAEFTVRGSAERQMGFAVDGVPAPWLVHSVYQVGDTASVSLVNGDVIDEVTLTAGASPQVYGNRTGAWIQSTIRAGSRDALRVAGTVSGTGAAVVTEGPLGRGRRGSWLVAAHQSYIDWIIRRLDRENQTTFGYTDAQAKLVFDVSSRQQLQLTLIGGRSELDDTDDGPTVNGTRVGGTGTGLAIATWRATLGASTLLIQRASWTRVGYRNTNGFGQEVARGEGSMGTYRADAAVGVRPWLGLDLGVALDRESGFGRRVQYTAVANGVPRLRGTSGYDRDRWSQAGYVRARPTLGGGALDVGARIDHDAWSGAATASPWLLGRWAPVARWSLSAGIGGAHQRPELFQIAPAGAPASTGIERARYLDASARYQLSPTTSFAASVYGRTEDDVLRLDAPAARLANGRVAVPPATGLWLNAIDVSSRGIELTLRRSAGAGLLGWVAYSYGRTRHADRQTGERYWGDFDQRHQINVHSTYRLGTRTNVSAKLRVGSNMPIAGYFAERNGLLTLAATRNEVRLPLYSRLDLRMNRTYNFTRRRLTLYAEVLNVLGRENVGYADGSVRTNGAVTGFTETLLPRLPSAGIRLEF